MKTPFEVQGHRGARGLRPENTLPSFEAALDHFADSIETDLVLTADGDFVLHHDFQISRDLCTYAPQNLPLAIRNMTRGMLSLVQVMKNPDPARFPVQQPEMPPLSGWFAAARGKLPYSIPTLGDLFAFVEAYTGEPGERFDKSAEQRANAGRCILDLELKGQPFLDDEREMRKSEEALLPEIHRSGRMDRCRVRSFDHRTVARFAQMEPTLPGCVLVAGTRPVHPARLAHDAGARFYCPDYRFLDSATIEDVHAAGLRVIPWTVNNPLDWGRLMEWGVDGITTDYPDRRRHVALMEKQERPPGVAGGRLLFE